MHSSRRSLFTLVATRILPVVVATLSLRADSEELAGFSVQRLKRIDAFAEELVANHQYSGLVIEVTRDGHRVYERAVGVSNGANRPLRTDDLFAVASLSKIVTTVATLILMEEGRLGLNDPLSRFIPAFADTPVVSTNATGGVQLQPLARPILIRHLLTHTSGIVSFDAPAGSSVTAGAARSGSSFASLSEAAEYVAHVPLKHQPGEAWTYGISTDVLGRVVEIASGMPFERFLEERIFRPLGMQDTAFAVPESKRGRQVDRDERQPDGTLKRVPAKPLGGPWPSGAGGLYSTPRDYLRLAHLLLNGGAVDGVRLLSPRTVELMRMDQLHGLPKPTKIYPVSDGFGLGVEIRTDVARAGWLGSEGTFGWNGASTCYCAIDPKEHLVMMIWAQHSPNAEFGLYERFNTLVYQAQIR